MLYTCLPTVGERGLPVVVALLPACRQLRLLHRPVCRLVSSHRVRDDRSGARVAVLWVHVDYLLHFLLSHW